MRLPCVWKPYRCRNVAARPSLTFCKKHVVEAGPEVMKVIDAIVDEIRGKLFADLSRPAVRLLKTRQREVRRELKLTIEGFAKRGLLDNTKLPKGKIKIWQI